MYITKDGFDSNLVGYTLFSIDITNNMLTYFDSFSHHDSLILKTFMHGKISTGISKISLLLWFVHTVICNYGENGSHCND